MDDSTRPEAAGAAPLPQQPGLSPTYDTRAEQMFFHFADEELARLERFGSRCSFAAGEMLARTGEAGRGLFLILEGEVEVRRREKAGDRLIVVHTRGSFLGELAQLSGRPFLVDAVALGRVEAVEIVPGQLRALLIAEADLGERLMRALILRRVGLIESGAGPIVIGADSDHDVLRLVNFLRRNGHPYQSLNPESDGCAQTLVQRFEVEERELPIVLCPDGTLLRNPTEAQLARCIGLVGDLDGERLYDLIVVGAGPSGLATSVYAGSEGLSVLLLDCRSFGGQAGASARIENYLGFPTGISGMALMGRAFSQAQKFGVEIAIPEEAVSLECGTDFRIVRMANGEVVRSRSVVLAMGARYRRLDVSNLDQFEGASVHYWASPLEADLAAGQTVVLVGGGNSAGQATAFLATRAKRVIVVARRPLEQTMSQYLIERITGLPNVEIVVGSEVDTLAGERDRLSEITLRDRRDGSMRSVAARHLFLFIGAEPNTDWLAGSNIDLDERGFIVTGAGSLAHETSCEGVFAVGDVRSGSVKRVASSVGDGAQVVAAIHQYLAAETAAAQPLVAAIR
jgi:thioredoxin reductase (NADPH)